MSKKFKQLQGLTTDDVAAIRVCAEQLRHENNKAYGVPGLEANRKRAAKAEAVADKIEDRLST